MKSVLKTCVLAFALVAFAVQGTAAFAGTPQTKCPVMGNEINKDLYADHNGKRVYFCCQMCLPKFKKNPKVFIKKLESQGVELEVVK
ncbi:TRASH domain-containing protein [Halodesulfovibrio sp.]|uniref:TRASH domain-containing protein n=1 Tax=Halodesulfovibrio sp. TaxID=1912772 RepID=UPI0025C6D0EE|nr:TRASH domain-containing protein [Halodesulfovibrio sp.]